jgi:hypothetical protein
MKEAKDATKRQRERFEQAAHELGCDESEERVREVVGKLAKAPPARNEPSKSRKAKAKRG